MQNETLPVCPRCGKAPKQADAAFCPYCGAPMDQRSAAPVPEGAQRLLEEAAKQPDPKKKYELLKNAQRQYPDCLEVAQELLFLGRLHERNPRKVDFSVIKCYLWHMYLTPEQFSKEQQAAMRAELFEHPDLKRCQALAPNAEAFTRQYLERLAQEFVRLFLRGSSTYMRSFFGIRFDGRASKTLAAPAAAMLGRIRADEALSPQRRDMLYNALYCGYLREMSGDGQRLDAQLGEQGLPLGAKP
ncbi:MAG: zinc ribbon domain-containing protein [Eubacteriales bacterium]|nr:zinc ribbon domain-containing protein [Eubacteriales bacterium]